MKISYTLTRPQIWGSKVEKIPIVLRVALIHKEEIYPLLRSMVYHFLKLNASMDVIL